MELRESMAERIRNLDRCRISGLIAILAPGIGLRNYFFILFFLHVLCPVLDPRYVFIAFFLTEKKQGSLKRR